LPKITLKVKNLTKIYNERRAVDNVSFEVLESEIFGFLGPNGAGKTTAIKMITGLSKITSGEVWICGYSIKKSFEKAINMIGAIIETPTMYSYMTGYQNLKYYASLYKGISKDRIMQIVELVGLEKRINEPLKNYSLGMRQRLGIAQALLHNPKILILDEPTNGLDPNGILEVRKFLKYLATKMNISIIISSHILAEMELICDTIAIIDNGQLKEIKTIDQIKNGQSGTQKVAIKVNYPNYAGKLIMEKFNLNVELAGSNIICNASENMIPSIISFLTSKQLAIFGVKMQVKSLEEMFLSIVGENPNNQIS